MCHNSRVSGLQVSKWLYRGEAEAEPRLRPRCPPRSEGEGSKGLSTYGARCEPVHVVETPGVQGPGRGCGPTGLRRQHSCAASQRVRARGKAVGGRPWKSHGSTMATNPPTDLAPGPGFVVPDPSHPKGCRPQTPCHGVLCRAKESRPSCGWQCAAEQCRAGIRDRALQGSSREPGQLSHWEEGSSRTGQPCRAWKAQEAGGGPGMLT